MGIRVIHWIISERDSCVCITHVCMYIHGDICIYICVCVYIYTTFTHKSADIRGSRIFNISVTNYIR